MTPYEKILAEVKRRANANTFVVNDHIAARACQRIADWMEKNRAELDPPTAGLTVKEIQAEMDRIKKEFGYVNKSVLGEWIKDQMKVKTEAPEEKLKPAPMDPEKRALIRQCQVVYDKACFGSSWTVSPKVKDEIKKLGAMLPQPGTPEHAEVFGIQTVGDLKDKLKDLPDNMEVRSRVPNEQVNPTVDEARNRVFL